MPKHKTMRITGGALVRRRFLIPELIDENIVRPTPDRVREAVFSMIKHELPGSLVVDLFAGSGAHAFEAISRGASRVIMVEKNPRIAEVIKNNIISLDLAKQCQLVVTDVLKFISQANELAQVIFVDPPYSLLLDKNFFTQLNRILADDGLVIFRLFKKAALDIGDGLSIERDRIYGGTRVLILRKALTVLSQKSTS